MSYTRLNPVYKTRYVRSESMTVAGLEKASFNIPISLETGESAIGACVMQVPNPNWVLANVSEVDATHVRIGYWSSASTSITGYFSVMLFTTA